MGKTARAVEQRSTRSATRGEPRRTEGARPAPLHSAKAKRPIGLTKTDLVSKVARDRFAEEVDGALKRRPANEARLAGALRAVAPLSPQLRAEMADALRVLLRRRTLNRDIYGAAIRSLAECEDKNAEALLKLALADGDAGGTPTLCAAAHTRDAGLAPLLAKVAASRQSHLAFGAETARVVRGESNGAHLAALAPMIKESHRISLCVELFVPLARRAPSPPAIARALYVLGEAERHLGRWLVLGQVATKAGDRRALEEARTKAQQGPQSSRAAWALLSWALADVDARTRGEAAPEAPTTRPTVELVARLSDRPSADRDMTFLFRMAHAGARAARPMLETLAKGPPPGDEAGVRACLYLARDHGREDLRAALRAVARGEKREELRGVAAAALWDLGMHEDARAAADELVTSRLLGNVAWSSLVRAAAMRGEGEIDPLCTETHVRWIQQGWLE